MLPLRGLHLDDVVVEIVALVSRRHGAQFGTGGVDEDSLEEADLGGDVGGAMRGKYLVRVSGVRG